MNSFRIPQLKPTFNEDFLSSFLLLLLNQVTKPYWIACAVWKWVWFVAHHWLSQFLFDRQYYGLMLPDSIWILKPWYIHHLPNSVWILSRDIVIIMDPLYMPTRQLILLLYINNYHNDNERRNNKEFNHINDNNCNNDVNIIDNDNSNYNLLW